MPPGVQLPQLPPILVDKIISEGFEKDERDDINNPNYNWGPDTTHWDWDKLTNRDQFCLNHLKTIREAVNEALPQAIYRMFNDDHADVLDSDIENEEIRKEVFFKRHRLFKDCLIGLLRHNPQFNILAQHAESVYEFIMEMLENEGVGVDLDTLGSEFYNNVRQNGKPLPPLTN